MKVVPVWSSYINMCTILKTRLKGQLEQHLNILNSNNFLNIGQERELKTHFARSKKKKIPSVLG